MTRINTNVSSLVAQNIFGRNNDQLQTALTRLSTGLRINSGKDDPAGLIAAEIIRSDLVSIEKAIGNSERANQVIATADSALNQVSSLLNDIRGLVTESANSGALSDEQIEANQLQVDSALDALNRIAQTTTFQGKRLLDGSLDFNTTAGSNFSKISNLQIDQANLGAAGSVDVTVNVSRSATQAAVDIEDIPSATAAAASAGSLTFDQGDATQASGTVTLDTASDATLELTAVAGGPADGAEGNGTVSVAIVDGAAEGTAYDDSTNTLTVTVDIAGGNNTVQDLFDAINNDGTDFTAANITDGGDAILATNTGTGSLAGGADSTEVEIAISANQSGDFDGTITFDDSADLGDGEFNVAVDSNNDITINVDDDSDIDLEALAAEITSQLADFTAVASGPGTYNGSTSTAPTVVDHTGGTAASGGIAKDVIFELAGKDGAEVFNVSAGSSIDNLVDQINLVKDATGVEATASGTTLQLRSVAFGSDAIIDLRVIEEDSGGTFEAAIGQGARAVGTDVEATVNGTDANAQGNRLSISTSTLSLTSDVAQNFIGTVQFSISGGGGLFQVGPDVVSNQQARIGITSVNTGRLGGVNGKLFQLKTGESAALSTDPTTASRIVKDAINKVTSLRGRLGAFQRLTIETNINSLNDTLVNLTDAESSIRDADFARETAALTRAQILVQSSTAVLGIANQNPQNVLALLQ